MCCAFINLVSHNYEFLVCHTLLDVLYLGFGGLLVDKPKHNLRLLQLLVGALDADVLDNVIGCADAGCVDKAELDAIDDGGVLDEVTGGAMHIAHDGFLFVQQVVE